MKKRWLCLAMVLVILFVLCSCASPKEDGTPALSTDLRVEGQPYLLSKVLMLKIARDYEMDCAHLEFEEGEQIPYEKIFPYFNYSGCFSFDEKTMSELVYPYYQNGAFVIPHKIVDDFLSARFNTVPNPESIDCYDPETGCYTLQWHFGELYCNMIPVAKQQLRDNVYQFTMEIIPGESYDVGIEDNYRTYVVELTADNYKLLSHTIGWKDKPED